MMKLSFLGVTLAMTLLFAYACGDGGRPSGGVKQDGELTRERCEELSDVTGNLIVFDESLSADDRLECASLLTASPAAERTTTPLDSTSLSGAGKLAFAYTDLGVSHGIYLMNADGSEFKPLVEIDELASGPAWSPDGSMIAFSASSFGPGEIYLISADGSGKVNLTNEPEASDNAPAWAPDGSLIAFASDREDMGEVWSIYVMEPDGSGVTKLTHNGRSPAWAPDGSRIAFNSTRDGLEEIYVMNADGTDVRKLTDNSHVDRNPSWSPDGRLIAFQSNRNDEWKIYVMRADGSDEVRLTDSPWDEEPAWSPDGTLIAFVSFRDGAADIFMMNADGSGQTKLTDTPEIADFSPAWSPVP